MKSNLVKIIGIICLTCIAFWGGYKWQIKSKSQIETDTTNKLFLPIYSVNPNSYEIEILDSMKVCIDEPLEDILRAICVRLSYRAFYNLPILIDSIGVLEGKRVVYVNLKESIGKMKWNRNFFQGTAGGLQTSMTLRENLLQRDYEGDWIDGLLVSYEGEPISKDYWDHMGHLHLYQWRDSI